MIAVVARAFATDVFNCKWFVWWEKWCDPAKPFYYKQRFFLVVREFVCVRTPARWTYRVTCVQSSDTYLCFEMHTKNAIMRNWIGKKRIRTLMTATHKMYWARAHVRLHSLSNGIHCHSDTFKMIWLESFFYWFSVWHFCFDERFFLDKFHTINLLYPTILTTNWDDLLLLMKWRFAEVAIGGN